MQIEVKIRMWCEKKQSTHYQKTTEIIAHNR